MSLVYISDDDPPTHGRQDEPAADVRRVAPRQRRLPVARPRATWLHTRGMQVLLSLKRPNFNFYNIPRVYICKENGSFAKLLSIDTHVATRGRPTFDRTDCLHHLTFFVFYRPPARRLSLVV